MHSVYQEAFVRDWAAGVGRAELARRYGMTTSGVDYWRRLLGCPSRPKGQQPPDPVVDEDAFLADWKSGMPKRDIATKHGLKSTAVVDRLAQARKFPHRKSGYHIGREREMTSSPSVLTGGSWVADDHGIMRWKASA